MNLVTVVAQGCVAAGLILLFALTLLTAIDKARRPRRKTLPSEVNAELLAAIDEEVKRLVLEGHSPECIERAIKLSLKFGGHHQ